VGERNTGEAGQLPVLLFSSGKRLFFKIPEKIKKKIEKPIDK
jgi:hypothetical protein